MRKKPLPQLPMREAPKDLKLGPDEALVTCFPKTGRPYQYVVVGKLL